MRRLLPRAVLAGALVAAPAVLAAQGLDGYGGGPKIYLNKDSSSFLRITLWSQVWTRFMQQNPGTMVNNVPNKDNTFDVGVRRTRILMHGQITPRVLVFWIIGVNNQTFNSGGLQGGDIGAGTAGIDGKRPQVFVHDTWGEFKVNNGLYVGGGILTWSGLSRMTNAATLNFMMVDAPIYNWTTIDASDQFARTMGLYAKGTLFGKLNYRAVLTKPFQIAGGPQGATTQTIQLPAIRIPRPGLPDTVIQQGTVTVNTGDNAATNALVATPARFNIANWNPNANTVMPQLYVNYDFFENESQVLPFTVGTYLGTKKVFNVGAGFQYHPEAMRWVRARDSVTVGGTRRAVLPTDAANPAPSGSARAATPGNNGDWVTAPMKHFAVDAFLDLPLGHDKDALTVHSAHYWLDYGPNYVRNIGIMPIGVANPATRDATTNQFVFTQPTFNGGGAAYPMHGTGTIWYTQAGYLLPKGWTKGFARWQPSAAVSIVDFERLGEKYVMPELGLGWYIAGHNAKIQWLWRRRPLYESAVATRDGLPATIPTTLGGATNQLYPTQVGMRRAGSRDEVIMQFHVHF